MGPVNWPTRGPNPDLPHARTHAFPTDQTISGIPPAVFQHPGHLYSKFLICRHSFSNGQMNIPFALDGLIEPAACSCSQAEFSFSVCFKCFTLLLFICLNLLDALGEIPSVRSHIYLT